MATKIQNYYPKPLLQRAFFHIFPLFLIGGLHLAKTPSPPLLIPYGSWGFNFYEVCHFRQKSVSLC